MNKHRYNIYKHLKRKYNSKLSNVIYNCIFRIPLTGLLYTVTVAGNRIEPNYIRAPVSQQASPGSSNTREYTGDVAYRVQDLQPIMVRGMLERPDLGKLEHGLEMAWKNAGKGRLNCAL